MGMISSTCHHNCILEIGGSPTIRKMLMLKMRVFCAIVILSIATFPTHGFSFTTHQIRYRNLLKLNVATDTRLVPLSRIAPSVSGSKTVSISRDVPTESDLDETESSPIFGDKPVLLYLPGLDGVENYSSQSVSKLNFAFDVWKMAISGDDRSSFMEIAAIVLKTLEAFDKPVILVGESFGGLLATYIALRAKSGVISKLVLINPATSYDRTAWPLLAPLIASAGPAFPLVGIATLLSTVSDAGQIQRVGQKILTSVNSAQTAVTAFNNILETGKSYSEQLSGETINFRIQKWFGVGASLMEGKFSQIKTPTLILIGKNDKLFPSQAEGKRLLREMTSSENVEVKEFDIGHALLEDGFLDIADEILKSALFTEPKNPLDIAFPTPADMEDVEKNFGPFLNAMSPVFLSKGKDGMLHRGVQSIPTGLQGRPVLLVGNHQLYGADCAQIIREFINTKSTLIRGLAHPLVFNDRDANPFMAQTLKKYGAVEVSPTSIFDLLKRNETVMLFPGGIREALHGKGEEYKLFWPEKVDFVRMAGMFDAIIVPFSSVGIAESVNIVFDKDDMYQVPFLGEQAKQMSSLLPNARPGDKENPLPPIFLPKAPERNYFLFGQPFDTRDLNIYDKKQCKILYKDVKSSVEDGLQTLFKFREADPYKDFLPRTIYEVTSGGKQAPTAPLNLKW